MNSNNRIAVIGSNSFAGSVFVAQALKNGKKVIGFNRSEECSSIFLPYKALPDDFSYRFVQANLNHDLEKICLAIEEFQPEIIVDFAGQGMVAESWQDPAQWYETNIVSKVRFHERIRTLKSLKKYIRISTPEVYGSQDNLLKEQFIFNPSTPYAVSHAAIDMSLKAFYQNYGFPVVFTRFANFYGPHQQLYRIVPRTIIFALTGKKLQLQGGGKSIRAFIYANDVADGVLKCIETGKIGEIYHFSSDRFLTIKSVVEVICERMKINFDDLVEMAPDRPGKDHAYLMDSNKAKSELNWRESVTFEQGVDATIAWIKSNIEEIQKLPLFYIHKD